MASQEFISEIPLEWLFGDFCNNSLNYEKTGEEILHGDKMKFSEM